MSYSPPYDGFSRSLSRRPSLPYSAAYSQGMYNEQPMYQEPYGGHSGYSPYGHSAGSVVPMSHRLTGPPGGYDDLDLRDGYDYDLPTAPYPQQMGQMMPRQRRHSTVSYVSVPPPMDNQRRGSGHRIKFKRKGSLIGGIGLDEAQAHVRLSNKDAYSYHDLHSDHRRRILLKVKWSGYNSLTYEIPLDGYDRRVDLETLARRVSRACVHYLQANVIPILWDRVMLHHLEEVSYGMHTPAAAQASPAVWHEDKKKDNLPIMYTSYCTKALDRL